MKKKKALLYNLVVRGHRLSFHSVHWFQETENCECIINRLTPDSFWILHNKGKWFTCKTKHFEDSLEFIYMKMQFVTPSFRFKTPKFWLDFGILRPSWFWQAFLMRPSISKIHVCVVSRIELHARVDSMDNAPFFGFKNKYFVTFLAFSILCTMILPTDRILSGSCLNVITY